MYWVEKRLQELKESEDRANKIASGTEPLWNSLSQALKDSLATFVAARSYGRFEQDGQNHHVYWIRYLEATPRNPTEEIKKVIITLDAGNRSITAKYSGVKHEQRVVTLDLDRGDVCLRKEAGDPLRTADVAAYLLDPFLFPELAGKTPIPWSVT